MVKANGYGLGAARGGAGARAARSVGLWGGHGRGGGGAARGSGIRRPILVVSPLTADTLEAILSLGLPSLDRRPGHAPRLGGPARTRRSTSRSTPGCLAAGSDGAMRRLAESRPVARRRSGMGRRLHPLSFRRHRRGGRSPSSGSASRRRSPRSPGGRRWCMPPTAPRRSCGPAYAADLIRPGIFLYGGEARPRARRRARWPRCELAWWRCAASPRARA